MNNTAKRLLALIISVLLLLPNMVSFSGAAEDTVFSAATDAYYTVGQFQQEGSIAKIVLAREGAARINIPATTLIDIGDYDPADLAIELEMRVTRHDGVTGENSLRYVQNGSVFLYDSEGNEVLKTASPIQQGVSAPNRLAGEWMSITFSLATLRESTGKLARLSTLDYNDIPKQTESETGITVEVRNSRIVDTTRYSDGSERVQYEVGNFSRIEGNYSPNSGGILYADWTTAMEAPIDVSADRGRYRLTLTIELQSSDETAVLPQNGWRQIEVKLRSSDVEGKEGDPTGTDNKEHNYGWAFNAGTDFVGQRVIQLSIPLDQASNRSRGIMDWSDIRRMICMVHTQSNARNYMTMTLTNARIVDMDAIDGVKAQLLTVIQTPQDLELMSEVDQAAYQQAKTAAQDAYDDEAAMPDALQAAMNALKSKFIATQDQRDKLQGWVSRELDPDLATAESYAAYEQAVTNGQALLTNAGATSGAVEQAIQATKEAWFALEFNNTLPVVDYGNVDSSEDGVTAGDALLALQAATSKITLSDDEELRADVDGQSGITANDALLILQYATKKIDGFAVKNEDLSTAITAVENTDPLTACNPIDISYMLQPTRDYRESADPAVVVFNNEYYLFASHGGGYWVSTDLADWEFIQVDLTDPVGSEFGRYAPATCVVGDTLYVTHSESGHMLRTKTPRNPSSWEDLGSPSGWMDPCMIYNDPADGGDGLVYVYMGLSHQNPINVVTLDPNNNMRKVGGPYECCWPDKINRGFEVPGDDNTNYDDNDTMEGPWVIKYKGKYYINCAVPGTGAASYADNCFVSDSLLGPFVFCDNSPVARKSTGFTQGAGHTTVFEDLNGNWWRVDTCRIDGVERRLVLLPVTFDEEGNMYTNTVRSDYPFYIPTEAEDPFFDRGPEWDLLSYGKKATASSNAGAAALALNENMTNWWYAATGDEGEWFEVDLGKVYGVWSVQVNFADQAIDTVGGRDREFAYRYLMEFSQDGETWYTMVDRTEQTEDLSHEYIEFVEKVGARYIRITNKGPVPAGGKFALCGLRVFGEGGGNAPAEVEASTVMYGRRDDDSRSMGISWESALGAQGYYIRYGLAPDKLYNHYQVIDNNSLVINSLNRGVDYYFAIDAYNESGVTQGTTMFHVISSQDRIEGFDYRSEDPVNANPAFAGRVDGVTVYEVESATLSEGLKKTYEARASKAYAVHGMGAEDSYVEFTGVTATASSATLRVCYTTLDGAELSVVVNGKDAVNLTLPNTRGWATFAYVDLPLQDLIVGENTIRLESTGDRCILDWIQVIAE